MIAASTSRSAPATEPLHLEHRCGHAPCQGASWMLGIAANLCASERRRQLREREIVQRLGGHRPLDEDDFTRLEHELDAASAYRGLLAALESLPPSERAVAELVRSMN